jgi:hypothetical protein
MEGTLHRPTRSQSVISNKSIQDSEYFTMDSDSDSDSDQDSDLEIDEVSSKIKKAAIVPGKITIKKSLENFLLKLVSFLFIF